MKILLYSTPGQAENVFPLYKALIANGADVTYFLADNHLVSTIFDVHTKIEKEGIIPASMYPELLSFENYMDLSKVFVVNKGIKPKRLISSLQSIFSVIRYIKSEDIDVVHTDMVPIFASWLLYFFRKKLIYLQHDPFPHSGAIYPWYYKLSLILVHKLAAKTVILNKTQYDDFCRINCLKKENVLVNKLGSLECIKLFVDKTVQERKNNVLFFGGISKYKGIEYLCQAMVKVHEIIPDATVTIVGGKPFYFDISQYERLTYFEIHNRFVSGVEMASFIQQSSICVFPYTDATQSGCVLTSYTLSKPVIATNLDTMREIVDEYKSGLLVPPCDSENLANAIIELLLNDQLRNDMRDYIAQSYFNGERSWTYIANKYLSFYAR